MMSHVRSMLSILACLAGVWPAASLVAQTGPKEPLPNDCKLIDRQHFDIDYKVGGPVSAVELWYTEDKGTTWKIYGLDADLRSPISFTAKREGLHGFKVIARNKNYASEPNPTAGAQPNFWCFMDWTWPYVQVTGPIPTVPLSGQATGQVILRPNDPLSISYSAVDDQLADRPIQIAYRLAEDGAWQLVARDQRNTGQFNWQVPASLAGKPIVLRVMATDLVGNIGVGFSKELVIKRVTSAVSPEAVLPDDRLTPTTQLESLGAPALPEPAVAAVGVEALPSEVRPAVPSSPGVAAAPPAGAMPSPPPPQPRRVPVRTEADDTPPAAQAQNVTADPGDAAVEAQLDRDALGMFVVEFSTGQPVSMTEFEPTLAKLIDAVNQLVSRKLASGPVGTALQGPSNSTGMVKGGRIFAVIPTAHRNREDAGLMGKVVEERLGVQPNLIYRTMFDKAPQTEMAVAQPQEKAVPAEAAPQPPDDAPEAALPRPDTVVVQAPVAELEQSSASSPPPAETAKSGPPEQVTIELADKPADMGAIRSAPPPGPTPAGPAVVPQEPQTPILPADAPRVTPPKPSPARGPDSTAAIPVIAPMPAPEAIDMPSPKPAVQGDLPVQVAAPAGGPPAQAVTVAKPADQPRPTPPSLAGVDAGPRPAVPAGEQPLQQPRQPADEPASSKIEPAAPGGSGQGDAPKAPAAASPADKMMAAELAAQARRVQSSEPEKAKALYYKALAKDGELIEANVNLAGLLLMQGDTAGAETFYRKALAVNGNRQTALFGLGRTLLLRGDPKGSKETLAKLLKLAADDATSWVLYGDACSQADDAAAARAAWEQAIKLVPADSPVARAARMRLK